MIWNKPNIDIENKLLDLAEKEDVKIDKEDYPDLIKWQYRITLYLKGSLVKISDFNSH